MLQSVSALLEKFRKSEQVFDPNVDPDSEDGEGWAPSQLEFQPESPTGERIQEFQENGGDSLGTLGHSKRWERGSRAGTGGWRGIPSPCEELTSCSSPGCIRDCILGIYSGTVFQDLSAFQGELCQIQLFVQQNRGSGTLSASLIELEQG